jgi:hypothetical protein
MDSLCRSYKHHKIKFRRWDDDDIEQQQRIIIYLADSFWKGGYSVVLLKKVMGPPEEITKTPDTISKTAGWDGEKTYRYKTPGHTAETDKTQKSTTWYKYEYSDPNEHEAYVWYFEICGDAIVGCRKNYWWLGE